MLKRLLIINVFFFTVNIMAQNFIKFNSNNNNLNISYPENGKEAAILLQKNINKISLEDFSLVMNPISKGIMLTIVPDSKKEFIEISSTTDIVTIKASSSIFLEYAVTTLLEIWEIKKFTPDYTYFPAKSILKFEKNKKIYHEPSYSFRGLLYPGSYDEDFRKWHKLDWYLDTFGSWGHTFHQLVPAKEYFKQNPTMFALYNKKRNAESICYSNDTVFNILKENLAKKIKEKPKATYFSVSQNDDIINCECDNCQKLNHEYGSPQGAHFYFLNQVAKAFPETKISTLAYLFTYQPPKNLILEKNLHILFCPIEANRAKPIGEKSNQNIANTLKNWNKLTPNILVWDYTVEFTNYLNLFPNWQTFQENYTFFKNTGVKGIFSQGYADVPGSLNELKQYILAKLLWDNQTDIRALTADFLRGYYGKAAPIIQEYLDAIVSNQEKSNRYLDIYSGPIPDRKSYLSPENMTVYDAILAKAEVMENDKIIQKRILKLRLDLEYIYFEQAKFYGKEPHGMFQKQGNNYVIKKNLETRVRNFTALCNQFGIYELSEGGLSPDAYLENWLQIAQNSVVIHKGENMKMTFLTNPAPEYNEKKEKNLHDGLLGHKDFSINWTGWYGNNVEIEIETAKTTFETLSFNCLEDQRHWIFLPKTIQIFGKKNKKWILIEEQTNSQLTESYDVAIKKLSFHKKTFGNFESLKIILIPDSNLPEWRFRKNKKIMTMVDEIIMD